MMVVVTFSRTKLPSAARWPAQRSTEAQALTANSFINHFMYYSWNVYQVFTVKEKKDTLFISPYRTALLFLYLPYWYRCWPL